MPLKRCAGSPAIAPIVPDRRESPVARKAFDEEMRQHTRVQNMHASHIHRGRDAGEQLKLLIEQNWWAATLIEGLNK